MDEFSDPTEAALNAHREAELSMAEEITVLRQRFDRILELAGYQGDGCDGDPENWLAARLVEMAEAERRLGAVLDAAVGLRRAR